MKKERLAKLQALFMIYLNFDDQLVDFPGVATEKYFIQITFTFFLS